MKIFAFIFCNCLIATAAFSNARDIRHEVDNHETEIQILQEKLANQETIVEDLQRKVNETRKANKGNTASATARVAEMEKTLDKVVNDLHTLHQHLTLAQEKTQRLEKLIEVQNKNLDSLQIAMSSLTQALSDDIAVSDYVVKPGDSLGKIAQEHGTNIRKIKEINDLNTDRIIVGQKLKLPEK